MPRLREPSKNVPLSIFRIFFALFLFTWCKNGSFTQFYHVQMLKIGAQGKAKLMANDSEIRLETFRDGNEIISR